MVLFLRSRSIYNVLLEKIPECIGNLTSLKQILCDICERISTIPSGLFNLPNLKDLSLFRTNINYIDIIDDILPSNINRSNNTQIETWFNDNFEVNSDTDFWFQLTPICENDTTNVSIPDILGQFIQNTAKCEYGCNYQSDFFQEFSDYCSPRDFGNGM